MAVESGWTSPSRKDLTHQPLEYTWAVQHMAEVAQVVHGAIHGIMTVVAIVDTTEVAMTVMMTGTTTTADPTEGDLLHHTTEGVGPIDPAHDHDPTLLAVIEKHSPSINPSYWCTWQNCLLQN